MACEGGISKNCFTGAWKIKCSVEIGEIFGFGQHIKGMFFFSAWSNMTISIFVFPSYLLFLIQILFTSSSSTSSFHSLNHLFLPHSHYMYFSGKFFADLLVILNFSFFSERPPLWHETNVKPPRTPRKQQQQQQAPCGTKRNPWIRGVCLFKSG